MQMEIFLFVEEYILRQMNIFQIIRKYSSSNLAFLDEENAGNNVIGGGWNNVFYSSA